MAVFLFLIFAFLIDIKIVHIYGVLCGVLIHIYLVQYSNLGKYICFLKHHVFMVKTFNFHRALSCSIYTSHVA
jgi:hypothetical protein